MEIIKKLEMTQEDTKITSQLTGFEPVRDIPIEFRVQRLNHSATIALSTPYIYLNFVIFLSLAL
jgi:hypothetical protein